jgi:hypothetical protein
MSAKERRKGARKRARQIAGLDIHLTDRSTRVITEAVPRLFIYTPRGPKGAGVNLPLPDEGPMGYTFGTTT